MAQGSQATFGEQDPRTCCLCGGRIVLGHAIALRFYHGAVGALAWHVPCEREHGWPKLTTTGGR